MTNIGVYDFVAEALEKFAEAKGTTIAEVVEEVIEYLDVLEM